MARVKPNSWMSLIIFIGGSIAAIIIYTLKKKKRKVFIGNSNDTKAKEVIESDPHIKPFEKKILVLGLDGAGKSTLLQRLSKSDSVMHKTEPTEGFNVICVHTDNEVSLNYWEIGGSVSVRSYWCKFLHDSCVLVFVVDSANQLRLSDAANELHKIISNDALQQVPLLVVATKQDVPGSVSVEAMDVILNLPKLRNQGHSVKVMPLLMPPEAPFHPSIKDVEDSILVLCGLTSKG